jgi:anti-sigma factor RsiW
MAFVDDQLDHEARAAFQERLPHEPELVREVVALQRLALMAQEAAPPEPIDLAWQHIDHEPSQRAVLGMGWLLVFAGALGMLAILIVDLAYAELPLWQKASLGAVFGGLSLVFLAILRRRIQSRPFDPYTAVKR